MLRLAYTWITPHKQDGLFCVLFLAFCPWSPFAAVVLGGAAALFLLELQDCFVDWGSSPIVASAWWQQRSFYGVNLSALHSAAVDEFFKQPIVDTFDVQILMARSVKHCINFMEAKEEDLQRVEIPFVFTLLQSGLVHGLAFWFDVAYLGSKSTVWLSTAPTEPLTRWYQVRCLLQTPLFAKLGQTLSGTVLLAANNRQSYDIHITATVDQSGFRSGNILDLKNPFFRTPTWFHG